MTKFYFKSKNKAIKNGYANERVDMRTGATTLTDKEHAMVFHYKRSEAEEMLRILNTTRDRFEIVEEE